MRLNDKKKFLEMIHPLIISFPYPILESEKWKEKINVYFKTLMPYRLDLINGAVQYLLANRTRSDFPNPGEIVKAMEKYLEQQDLIMEG